MTAADAARAVAEDYRLSANVTAYEEGGQSALYDALAEAFEKFAEALEDPAEALEDPAEIRCNCGFGGFHEPSNPRCARNGGVDL